MANLKQIVQIFLLPVMIVIIHAIFSLLGVYDGYWWADVLMHFTGGVFIGMSYVMLLGLLQKEGHVGKMNKIAFFTFIISLVALTALVWEFGEFSSDLIFDTKVQVSLSNTMQDLFLGVCGGIIGYSIKGK